VAPGPRVHSRNLFTVYEFFEASPASATKSETQFLGRTSIEALTLSDF
jgi:hypothetical protein